MRQFPSYSRAQIRGFFRFYFRLEQVFGIDTRSLAFFRVTLSVLLLIELVYRMKAVVPFYTDFGVLPRELLVGRMQNYWSYSFHLASGSAPFQVLLISVGIVAALALLIGYRTRAANIVSWLLLVSLFVRNPLVLSSGDGLLMALLFWGMFLPLNAQWSVDRALAPNADSLPRRILSVPSAAILIQAALVYVFTRVLKSGEPWHDGTAAYLALNWDQGTTALGRFMLHFPDFLQLATHGVMIFELLGPLLLFVPFYTPIIRLILIPCFYVMHLSFAMLMLLFTFPYVSMVSLIPFLPSQFWDIFSSERSRNVTLYYDGGCGFCKTMVALIRTFLVLPNVAVHAAQTDETIEKQMREKNSWVIRSASGELLFRAYAFRYLLGLSPIFSFFHYLLSWPVLMDVANRTYDWIAARRPSVAVVTSWLLPRALKTRSPLIIQLAALFFIVYVIIWNIAGVLKVQAPLLPVVNIFYLHQQWSMFSPFPRTADGWFVIPAKLKNGEEVDLFKAVISGHGEVLDWGRPPNIARTFPDVYWRKYTELLIDSNNRDYYSRFCDYLYRAWNGTHPEDQHLVSLNIYYMLEDSNDPGAAAQKRHLWEYYFTQ